MQITFDPATLTASQRDHVIKFIKDFPIEFTLKGVIDQSIHDILLNPPAEGLKAEVPVTITTTAIDPDEVAAAFGTPAANDAPSSNVELDKEGFPWDARIHSSNHAKVADGTWRKKRGVDTGLVATVEGELKQLMGVPAGGVATAPPPPPAPPADAMPPIPTFLARAPEAPTATVAPADSRGLFVALIGRTSAALQAGKLTQAEVAAICNQHGFAGLPLLARRPDLVPQVAASIDALIARVK